MVAADDNDDSKVQFHKTIVNKQSALRSSFCDLASNTQQKQTNFAATFDDSDARKSETKGRKTRLVSQVHRHDTRVAMKAFPIKSEKLNLKWFQRSGMVCERGQASIEL